MSDTISSKQKSFTAKAAKHAKEGKSFTAEGAKAAKDYNLKFGSAVRFVTGHRSTVTAFRKGV